MLGEQRAGISGTQSAAKTIDALRGPTSRPVHGDSRPARMVGVCAPARPEWWRSPPLPVTPCGGSGRGRGREQRRLRPDYLPDLQLCAGERAACGVGICGHDCFGRLKRRSVIDEQGAGRR
jgi:hypothetical protein